MKQNFQPKIENKTFFLAKVDLVSVDVTGIEPKAIF